MPKYFDIHYVEVLPPQYGRVLHCVGELPLVEGKDLDEACRKTLARGKPQATERSFDILGYKEYDLEECPDMGRGVSTCPPTGGSVSS